MPAKLIEKRLQIQPTGGRLGMDRSVTYFIGEPDAAQQRKLARRLAFKVADRLAASRHFAELHALAKEAVETGTVPRFLDTLDKREGTPRDTGPTFDDFAEQWKSTILLANGHPESERETTLSIIRKHLVPFFGRYRLREITSAMVDRYKAAKSGEEHQFGKGYSASAINSQLSVLNRIFKKAVEYGLADATPVRPSAWRRRERTPEDTKNWWTPEEEAKAFAHLRAAWRTARPEQYMPLVTQLLAGIRVGELRVLQPSDLDFNAPGIWIRRSMARKAVSTPRNGHARFVPIPRTLAEELRTWAEGRAPDSLLFPAKGGGPLRNNVVNRWWARLAEEAGVRRISSHGARHTTGSTLAFMGVGQKVIGVALGHRDSKATERYVHVAASAIGGLAEERWSRLARSAGPDVSG